MNHEPSKQTANFLAECACGWSLRTNSEAERARRLRYHRLLVHADPHAVEGPAF